MYNIDKIIDNKNNDVGKILTFLKTTEDHDKRIIPCLMDLILRENHSHYNGTLLFACSEYSPNECKPYFEDLVNIVINGDYEAAMEAATIIYNFTEINDEWSDDFLDSIEKKLMNSLKQPNDNEEYIRGVLSLVK